MEYSFSKLYSHIIAAFNDFLLWENFAFPEMSGCLNRTRAGVIIYLPQNSSLVISRTNNSAWIKSRNRIPSSSCCPWTTELFLRTNLIKTSIWSEKEFKRWFSYQYSPAIFLEFLGRGHVSNLKAVYRHCPAGVFCRTPNGCEVWWLGSENWVKKNLRWVFPV